MDHGGHWKIPHFSLKIVTNEVSKRKLQGNQDSPGEKNIKLNSLSVRKI
jgi:hypothetical protein